MATRAEVLSNFIRGRHPLLACGAPANLLAGQGWIRRSTSSAGRAVSASASVLTIEIASCVALKPIHSSKVIVASRRAWPPVISVRTTSQWPSPAPPYQPRVECDVSVFYPVSAWAWVAGCWLGDGVRLLAERPAPMQGQHPRLQGVYLSHSRVASASGYRIGVFLGDLLVDRVVAKRRLVLAEAEIAKPPAEVHGAPHMAWWDNGSVRQRVQRRGRRSCKRRDRGPLRSMGPVRKAVEERPVTTDASSRRPLSCAFRSFTGPILKGSKGSAGGKLYIIAKIDIFLTNG
jgi:hypothetical protein